MAGTYEALLQRRTGGGTKSLTPSGRLSTSGSLCSSLVALRSFRLGGERRAEWTSNQDRTDHTNPTPSRQRVGGSNPSGRSTQREPRRAHAEYHRQGRGRRHRPFGEDSAVRLREYLRKYRWNTLPDDYLVTNRAPDPVGYRHPYSRHDQPPGGFAAPCLAP